jgi:cell division protein FtsL
VAALNRPATAAPRLIPRRVSGRLLLILAVALVLVIGVIRVNQFSRLTTSSYEINDLQRLRDAKQARNHEVEAEVAALSSLARVEWQARTEMGMVPPARRLDVSVNQPVPERQTLPTRYLPVEPPAGDAADATTPVSFWQRALKALLPFF